MEELLSDGNIWLPAVIVIVIFIALAIKIVKEYERLVVFRLGR